MPELSKNNGKFFEYEFEETFISKLEEEGWIHTPGSEFSYETVSRSDLGQFLSTAYPDFTVGEIDEIIDIVQNVGADTEFAALHKFYNLTINGIRFTPRDGMPRMIYPIDFEKPDSNIFRAVNQLTVKYRNQGREHTRRPDIVLYINGLPLCIIELKNPANEDTTIFEAWKQINTRYMRDIPHLMHFIPLACISDGSNTRLGTVHTPYEHFYAWRRVNDDDKLSTGAFDEFECMLRGVFAPERFLEIYRDYIYFQDTEFDPEEKMIVCRYPQFFAARLLKKSIIKSVKKKTHKGGTYFGATGCGKTFTMAFLARQLAIRCTDVPEIGSPTVVLIVDRDDLQEQGAKLFTKSKEFLQLGDARKVESRADLRNELMTRKSGGFYICTIQKFCDRAGDELGLINDRANIICFSDEAHRTQTEHAEAIKYSKDTEENMRAMVSKPYAKVLREAFPNATFVGFTGTPTDESYHTFGEEIDRYTMDRAVADGLTVPIKYHPRISKVMLDSKKAEQIEKYYKTCAEKGASAEAIEASKISMSSLEIILKEPERLRRVAEDIHDHYTRSAEADPGRIQKAMVVCSNREIAFELLKIFKDKYPEWFEEKKHPDDVTVSDSELRSLAEMPFMAMVASVGKDDKPDLYNYLGGTRNHERSIRLANAFKQEKSNFRIVIVVDMWITGFDVETLTYLYNDKPLHKHMLIQTISRVNRKYPGKEFGLVVDYIGIRDNLRQALKIYGGENQIAPKDDDVAKSVLIFRDHLEILKALFEGYDLSPFLDPDTDPVKRYELLAKAAEFVFFSTREMSVERKNKKGENKVPFKTYFLNMVKKMRSAYDICQPAGALGSEESALAQCFMAIAGFVRKMSGTSGLDTETMNRTVEKMVEEALKYNKVEDILEEGETEDILSPEYFNSLTNVKMPASKFELLTKILRKQIGDFKKTNLVKAKIYQEMLENTIRSYHERRKKLSEEEAGEVQDYASEEIIKNATEQALDILKKVQADRESYKKTDLTFEEKAFYDILIMLRDKKNFEYGEDKKSGDVIVNEKCRSLAKKIKKIIDDGSQIGDWLNNKIVRNRLKLRIKICLIKNGYPPKFSSEVFENVMEQVENFNENNR